jgi:hypothetical protein
LCRAKFTPYGLQRTKRLTVIAMAFIELDGMKALKWKAALATLNPSPVFEAVGRFAEELAMNRHGLDRNKSALNEREKHVTATSINAGRAAFK